MNTIIDVKAVTAVRIKDGWREVTEFQFYGDTQHSQSSGASWRERDGCRYTFPMMCVLGTREGTPVAVEDADAALTPCLGRPAVALQKAIDWLERELQDNEAHQSKVLIMDAKAAEGINPETLRRAKDTLKVRDFSVGIPKKFYWVLDPIEAEDVPQQTLLIEVEGAE